MVPHLPDPYVSHIEPEALVPNRIVRLPPLERSFAAAIAVLLWARARVLCAVFGHELEAHVVEMPAAHVAAWHLDLLAERWVGTWCARCGYQP